MSNLKPRRPQFRLIRQNMDHGRVRPETKDEAQRACDYTAFRRSVLRFSRGCHFRDPVTGRRCACFPVTLHHRAGREGKNLFRFAIPVCVPHHDWIHANEPEARRLGYLIDPPREVEANDDPVWTVVPRTPLTAAPQSPHHSPLAPASTEATQ